MQIIYIRSNVGYNRHFIGMTACIVTKKERIALVVVLMTLSLRYMIQVHGKKGLPRR